MPLPSPNPGFRPRSLTLAALCLLPGIAHAAAPGSLHFQGRVSVDGVPFTGTGQFRFALLNGPDVVVWSSSSDVDPADGQPDTPVSLPVTKGLYAVQLGTGMEPIPASLFSTHDQLRLRVWFDDGTHGPEPLSPDQPLAAVPYARHSASAETAQSARTAEAAQSAETVTGPVPAAQLTGTLPIAQLPDTVARLDSPPTFTGTVRAPAFEGAGAILWTSTTAAEVDAQPNTGIAANRDNGPVLIHLPEQAQPGAVVRASGSGKGGWTAVLPPGQAWKASSANRLWVARETPRAWSSIAMSGDGRKLAAVAADAPVALSTDSGRTWTLRGPGLKWSSIVSSDNGSRLVAAVRGGSIWTSTDSGLTWTDRGTSGDWRQLAISADGLRLVAAETTGSLWNSKDGGATWTRRTAVGETWSAIACSASGVRAIAGAPKLFMSLGYGAHLTTSANSGDAWVFNRSFDVFSRSGCVVAMSADGNRLIAGIIGSGFQVSDDFGTSWAGRASPSSSASWASMDTSSDGTQWVVGTGDEGIWTSSDSGATWIAHPVTSRWTTVASSADGVFLAAAEDGGRILLSSPGLQGGEGSLGEFVYLGNNLWHATLHATLNPAGNLDGSNVLDLPASAIASGTLDPDRIPPHLPGTRTFDGPVGIGGYHELSAPLGIRADAANASFGYCLSLHDQANTPAWKLGVDTSRRFSLGASGLRDYDLSVDTTSGNVGIGGTPLSDRKLRVVGSLRVQGSGVFDGRITSPGFDVASDARLKTDITPLDHPLDRLDALRGVSFAWRTNREPGNAPGSRELGFIAQEVATTLPDLVHTNAEGFLSVNYVGVTPVLVEALRELRHQLASELASRDSRIQALQARLDQLEATRSASSAASPTAVAP